MPNSKPVKIMLITGYLGAGKTTLLNRILANDLGIRAAVIVNDIGEVNVDANLIAKGGVVDMGDSSLVPLTNGCICCTLADDLAAQLQEFASSGNFDYVIIEASGICEPIPIAYTISAFCAQEADEDAPMELDNIVAVVDSARMFDEFNGGKDLLADDIDEDDIESLLIQQLEFCTTVILNKADLVTPEQLGELRALVRSLQKGATIIEATDCNVPLEDLLDTGRFSFEEAFRSAAWVEAMEHPEEHEDPEILEYDIATFVYERRVPFSLDALQELSTRWPQTVIRSKGLVWFDEDPDMCYLFEQSGQQFSLMQNGMWLAAADPEDQERAMDEDPDIRANWDEEVGDREIRLVVIGRHMDRAAIEAELDSCLADA